MSLTIGLVQRDIFCFQNQSPPFGHRIPGIDAQIHDDLFDLNGISIDIMNLLVESKVNPDHFRDGSFKQPGCRFNGPVQIHLSEFALYFSAENQELFRQLGGLLCGFFNGFELHIIRVVGFFAHQQDLAVTGYGLQNIIKIVRNAAGQSPDGLHLVGMEQLGLQAFPFRDVAKRHKDSGELPTVVVYTGSTDADIEKTAVLGQSFGFKTMIGNPFPDQGTDHGRGLFLFGFGNHRDGSSFDFFQRPSEKMGECGIQVPGYAFEIIDDDRVGRRVQE